ncbi:MAG: ABC transporter ATP-binding protein [Patescibacteria group bacterium]|nr:ABC transporter ATP-binding protein [Patescibacteria group bacterium]
MAYLKIKNIKKDFKDLKVLGNINFEVEEDELICIVGPSGCGKTTLLRIIIGLEQPTAGNILIKDKSLKQPVSDLGFVFQESALFPWRSVLGNVKFPLEIKGIEKEKREEIARKYLKLVGLEGFEDSYPFELSGGMKQRAALARVLAKDSEILLMDEPFASVDAQTSNKLQEELVNLWQKTMKTIIFITHSIDEAVYLSDKILVLSKSPSVIKKVFTNVLPRPRDRNSSEFIELKKAVMEEISD